MVFPTNLDREYYVRSYFKREDEELIFRQNEFKVPGIYSNRDVRKVSYMSPGFRRDVWVKNILGFINM